MTERVRSVCGEERKRCHMRCALTVLLPSLVLQSRQNQSSRAVCSSLSLYEEQPVFLMTAQQLSKSFSASYLDTVDNKSSRETKSLAEAKVQRLEGPNVVLRDTNRHTESTPCVEAGEEMLGKC